MESNAREIVILPYAQCVPGGECLQCPLRGRAIVYGPFVSRRRGASVGVNLFPGRKVCSFDCVYCFRGETEVKTAEPVEDLYRVITGNSLKQALEIAPKAILTQVDKIDAIDFSGSGEPTLHARFPELVDAVLSFTREHGLSSSVGVFTNSSTLWRNEVVRALERVEHVEAKLDTTNQQKFIAINKPVDGLSVLKIIEWLKNFRRRFRGTLSVQVMLVKYGSMSNFSEREADELAEKLLNIEPDVVNVYTVYRTPRLSDVLRADDISMKSFAERLKKAGLRVELYSR